MVKKFLAAVFVVLAVVLFGSIATATPAQAAKTHSITSSTGVAKAVPTFVTESVTPVTLASTAPKAIGGFKPLYVLNNCHYDMWGNTWCYRSMCTYFDWAVLGCYDGWIKINRPWYA